MFWVYILKSLKDKDLYIGYISDLEERLKEHNSGKVKSTKERRSLRYVYAEMYASEEDARKREYNLKLHGRARRQLLKRIEKSIAS